MTDQERAAALADEIADEMNELRKRFANRENDHFSFGLKFSSWDVILAALRRLAEQSAPSPVPADLREVMIDAIKAVAISVHDAEDQGPIGYVDVPEASDAALSAIQREHVILPREPTHEMLMAGYYTACKYGLLERLGFDASEEIHEAMVRAAIATEEPAP